MKKYLLLLVPVVLIAINGCTKINGHTVVPSTGSSGSTGTIAGIDTSKGYLPNVVNTYWKYAESGIFTDTVTQTVIGTITLNGTLYNVIDAKSKLTGAQTGYMSNVNHVYTWRDQSSVPGTILFTTYLKDNVAAGTTWTTPASSSGTINGLPAQVYGTLIASNLTKTVSGKTFNYVIHTNVQMQYNMGSGFVSYGVYDYYIAKGVGIIEIDSSIGGATGTTVLIDYSIK